jgi:hypothetical protein
MTLPPASIFIAASASSMFPGPSPACRQDGRNPAFWYILTEIGAFYSFLALQGNGFLQVLKDFGK